MPKTFLRRNIRCFALIDDDLIVEIPRLGFVHGVFRRQLKQALARGLALAAHSIQRHHVDESRHEVVR